MPDPRRRQDTDLILLAANAAAGRLLKAQLKFHNSGDIPVFSTSTVNSFDGRSNVDLNGVMFTDTPWLIDPQPWPKDPCLTAHDGDLYLTYESQSIHTHKFEGSTNTWSTAYDVKNTAPSPHKPALASYKGELHLFYSSGADVYRQKLEGDLSEGEWSDPVYVPLDTSVGGEIAPIEILATHTFWIVGVVAIIGFIASLSYRKKLLN